ncbi:hypothetical protein BSL78_12472 [Apostichopus japonicus]|uniref:C2H2-type domain-containing protein n=1 Tax=Stichopus japonicus TaxID=307972 RepID=A0A2G8KRJ1_STIJA|nr:hypothetical protein BSL78_12472 [Apostichopus japonicus]
MVRLAYLFKLCKARLLQAHPSIRVKGFENVWEPVICTDRECEFREKSDHMHCPLCPLKVCSQDEAYIKMHFRVKHVDEGVDCEAGFFNLKCFSHCWVISCQKEKQVRTPHWHCHRCGSVSTKKNELQSHFESPKNKGKHDTVTQIVQNINLGMNDLKSKQKDKNLPSAQRPSNKHDVTTQTLSEPASVLLNRTLLKATRDNTKLRRQLKIVTAIMLIPGRNRNTQESSPPSNQPKVTTRSSQNGPSDVPVPETSIDVSVENDKPSNSALPSPARTCQNTTSVVTLPSVTVSLSSPSSLSSSSSSSSLDTDSSSDATEQLGGRNTDVTVTAPSVISRNDHLPIESTSLVTNCTASVRNQSSPYLSGDSISPASVTTSKETSSKHQCDENSLMMRTITSSQSPCSSSSFTNTSNSLCQSSPPEILVL